MYSKVFVFIGVLTLFFSCDQIEREEPIKLFSANDDEVLLDKRIEDAQKRFRRYGWIREGEFDKNDPNLRKDNDCLDLDTLELVLNRLYEEGVGVDEVWGP